MVRERRHAIARIGRTNSIVLIEGSFLTLMQAFLLYLRLLNVVKSRPTSQIQRTWILLLSRTLPQNVRDQRKILTTSSNLQKHLLSLSQ